MYLSHFNIKEKPFTLSTDPRFLWVGPNQRQALLTLTYGLQENEGLVVLGGKFGTGKTTLVNAFVQGLDEDVIVSQLPEPGSNPALFLQNVADGFGIKAKIESIDHLAKALEGLDDGGRTRKKLLIIDEAQRLIPELQDELLRLAQLRQAQSRLIHILLVGQNELYHWLAGPTREAFIKEVLATCKLHPLREEETVAYIDHRLHMAGAGRTPFTSDAIQEIHSFSQGMPRTINLICDYSFLHAHLEDLDQIDARTVAVCKDRFQIASLPDAESTEDGGQEFSPVVTEPPPPGRTTSRRVLPRTAALILLLLAAGFYFHHDSSRRPHRTQAAGVLEPTPSSAARPSPRPETPSVPLPVSPITLSPADTAMQPSPLPVETVATTLEQTDSKPTAPTPPPVVKQPTGHDDTDGLPSPDRRAEASTESFDSQQAPPAIETDPPEETDEPERLVTNGDPGAIIDWLIQESRKE